MNRRMFLLAGCSIALASSAAASDCGFEICLSEAEWRARLDRNAFRVLREGETERPHSSALNHEYRPGRYHCRGCDLPVYDSTSKFESGTGWPSFSASLPNAVETREDRKFVFQVRTEVHCRRCGSHLGHVFDDGPAPTGKRHCLNGLSLIFVPSA